MPSGLVVLLVLFLLAKNSGGPAPPAGSVASYKGVQLMYLANADAWVPSIPSAPTPWAKGSTLTFPGGRVYAWNGARFEKA